MTLRRERAVDALALALLKAAVGYWVLARGFTHVSDDDYARTVIAQGFAHAPKLDPSGTSWLPFPFWLEGLAMAAGGRTLATARAVAWLLGCLTAALPYLAMRAARVERIPALAATACAMAMPWNAWLGVATVPEGWAEAVVAAAVIAMPIDALRLAAAAALFAASLSRYEAWAPCAMLFVLCLTRARGNLRREALCAAVAMAGPLAWMAWNAHAHGSAIHFLARVSTYRQAIGAASIPLSEKVLGVPRTLARDMPEAAIAGLVGLAGMSRQSVRSVWAWPLATVAAILLFLIAGDLGDGAPTHHPARALAAITWILVGAGAHALWTARTPGVLVAAGASLAWLVCLPARLLAFPGQTPYEQRQAQIRRGADMRDRGVHAATITPCAYEHFALLAAWGEPENATLAPMTHEAVTDECPKVVEAP